MTPPADPAAQSRRAQRRVLIGVGFVCLLATAVAVSAATRGGEEAADPPATSTPTSLPTSSTAATIPQGPPADLPLVPQGETIDGPTECPAADGSSPRVTRFAGPPPMCIDPELDYKATIRTELGDLELLLQPERAPQAVNNFVVLARYHFYDGTAFNGALPRSHVQAGGAIEGFREDGLPGYTLPAERLETIYTPGTLAVVPDRDGNSTAEFIIMTLDRFHELPLDLTTMGFLLNGTEVLTELDRLGTESGAPSGVVRITSIEIVENEVQDNDG